jgi:23S rRNA pseudouridine1911/1915/1917 synthase
VRTVDASPAELDILCEDGPLIAVNKPAGLLTQGVPQGHPTLEARVKHYLRQKYGKPGNVYLGVPHRLDRPVSGIVVFARNSKAAARLAEQFRERSVNKIYLAVVERVPSQSEGRLTDWLLKDAAAAHVTVVGSGTAGAKEAVLDYKILAERAGRALLEVELHTGRMHQIRVQLASRGWPIVGDRQYGAAVSADEAAAYDPISSPIALHAWRLSLFHPIRYDRLRLEAPLPAAWSNYGFTPPPTPL